MDGCPVTDWITAIATVGAAVGTIAAVWVALWQVRRNERRSLHVECSLGIAAPMPGETVHIVGLRATNDGRRPIKVTQAYIQTNDGRKVVGHFTPWSEPLPKLVLEGESVEVSWPQSTLEQAQQDDDIEHYLFAFFTDTIGYIYPAAYPGVERKRKGPPWRRRTEWEPKPENS